MLKQILQARIGTQRVESVAGQCGLTRGALYLWLAGTRVPDATHFRRFLAETGDPDDRDAWDAWTEAWKLEAARRLRSRAA